MVGCCCTSLARTNLPFEGDMEGKVMVKEKIGVKVSGMALEGRRFAFRSESRRVVEAMIVDSALWIAV